MQAIRQSSAFSTARSHGRVAMAPARPLRLPGRRLLEAPKSGKSDNKDALQGVVATGTKLVDGAADLVPASVPRPVAKAGVALAMGLLVFGILKQIVSGVVTLALMGGLAYYFFTRSGDDNDDGPSSKSKDKDDDLNDPLSDARRIMDKYK